MSTLKTLQAQKIKSRILDHTTIPKVAWYIKEDRDFLSKYRTIVIYIAGNDGHWRFVSTNVVTGFNGAGLTLVKNMLGDTVTIRYDRTEVALAPDYLDIQYRIEHKSSARQSSDRFKAWGAIRKISTEVFTQ